MALARASVQDALFGGEVSYLIGERLIVLAVLGFAERRGAPGSACKLFPDGAKSAAAEKAPACKAAG